MSLSFMDVQCDLGRRAEAIEAVCGVPEIMTVEEAARNRDLMLTVITPSLADLNQDVISDGPPPRSSAAMLQVLMRNGRATAVEVANAVGGHPATARRQVNRLLDSRLLSFRCEMAHSYSGYPVSGQWFARVPAGRHDQIAQELRSFRNARLIASTTGSTNLIVVMWLRSVADVLTAELAMAERVRELELVESAVILNTSKRVGWRLNPDGTATGAVDLPAGRTEPARLEFPA